MNLQQSSKKTSSQKPKLPTGPRQPAILQMLSYMRDPIGTIKSREKDYGDWYTIRAPMMPPIVMTSSLDAANTLLKINNEDVLAGEAIAPLYRNFLGNASLFVLDGEKHLRQRRLMLPAFMGERMRQYFPEIQKLCQNEFKQWSTNTSFSLLPKMQSLTLRILMKSVFGIKEGSSFDKLHHLMDEFVKILIHPYVAIANLVPFLRAPFGPWAKMKKKLKVIRQLLYLEVQTRKKNTSQSQYDILSVLIQAKDENNHKLSDDELIDEMITLLVAGYDTTSIAISWLCYDIWSHTDCFYRIKNELEAVTKNTPMNVEHLDKFKYLDAVIKESMRLHPVVPGVIRKLKKPMLLDKVSLPKDVIVGINLYDLNHNPKYWMEPEAFKPERFLVDELPDIPFIPFGGGIRRCIGRSFSLFEMKIMIIEMLQHTNLSLLNKTPIFTVQHGTLFAPDKGVMIKNRTVKKI